MAAELRRITASALRRMTASGYGRYIISAALFISAVAVMFAMVDPDPVTSGLFFSSAASAPFTLPIVPISSAEEVKSGSEGFQFFPPPLESEESDVEETSSGGDEVKVPPLQSEPPVMAYAENSSGGGLVVPPSQSPVEEPSLSPTELSKAKENFLNSGGEDSIAIPSQSEVHIGSNADEVKSGSVDMELPPLQPEKAVRVMTATDQELIHAREEIHRAPINLDDPDLYAPLFRNVSVFKRSYELMERILKVYIYRDGQRPIFHVPVLKGIYASEGWFLKLMEANKQFVVKDPNKAHLFYLPYCAHKLEETLYKPDSHNLMPLAIFLKNYVEGISARYPFWNRTRGADHFLVACHDWGPYTTTLHEELRKNTIKALCNADLSEGVFIKGKDVSLPETSISNPKKLLRGIGGKPVSRRSILAFFAGNMHGRVRPILLQYWSGKDEEMKIYGPLPAKVSRKMSYIEHMKSSKFCICPMGYEVNSPRIVEAIYYECVPVIIADNFVLPFEDVLDWSTFSLVVAEKDIPNLKDILSKISPEKYVTMQSNVKRLQRHFLWHPRPVKYDIFHMILHSIWFNRLNQIQVHGE